MTVDTVAARSIKGDRVRRWWAALLCAVALGVTSACGSLPYGIDGNLTDEWVPPPGATAVQARGHRLLRRHRTDVALVDYAPIDCAQRHLAETFFVGELTGERGREEREQDRRRRVGGGRRVRPPRGPVLRRRAPHRPAPGAAGAARRRGLAGRRALVPLRRDPGRSEHRRGGQPHRQPARRPQGRRAAGPALLPAHGPGRERRGHEGGGLRQEPRRRVRRAVDRAGHRRSTDLARRRPDGEGLPVGHRRLGQGPGRRQRAVPLRLSGVRADPGGMGGTASGRCSASCGSTAAG